MPLNILKDLIKIKTEKTQPAHFGIFLAQNVEKNTGLSSLNYRMFSNVKFT